jgi:hypothetical protein
MKHPCSVVSLLAFLALFFSLPIGEVHAQGATPGIGLEVDAYQSVEVIVEYLHKNAQQISLTKERLQTRVELRLRQAKLKPGRRFNDRLYVEVNVVGHAFTIDVAFIRKVFYSTDTGTKFCSAITWNNGSTGTHVNNSAFIIQSLDALLDQFLNEYLKANGQ